MPGITLGSGIYDQKYTFVGGDRRQTDKWKVSYRISGSDKDYGATWSRVEQNEEWVKMWGLVKEGLSEGVAFEQRTERRQGTERPI